MSANPRKLRPADMLQALNSTPLGTVLTERQIYTHRMTAGLRIAGDKAGKTMDLLRYAAWLFDERRKRASKLASRRTANAVINDAYEAHKERARARQAEASESGRDIGPIPAVVNWKRRNACEWDLPRFNETYFPNRCSLELADLHHEYMRDLQQTILEGGQLARAYPRGSGKTGIAEVACLWAKGYGHRRFVVLIGPAMKEAREMLKSIKTELDGNELLAEDFPEMCFPIVALNNNFKKIAGQLCEGESTRMEWTPQHVVLPTPGPSCTWSKCAGSKLEWRTIIGGLRGMKHTTGEGKIIRPDFVIVDDMQTKTSARSMLQCQTREEILHGDVLKLAGPGKKIACLVTCTVIRKGDVADRVTDRRVRPQWRGIRMPMVVKFPGGKPDGVSGPAVKLWDEYANLRRSGMRDGDDGASATQYYALNRVAMDAGAVTYWPARFDPGEISAVQNAMNQLIDDPVSFWAECQQQPVGSEDDASAGVQRLSVVELEKRIVPGLARGVVPLACNKLVAGFDVQQSAIFWLLLAAGEGFTAHIVDYGVWPDQGLLYFTLREAKQTLQRAMPGANLDAQIYHGLEQAADTLLSSPHRLNEAGAAVPIERIVPDANYQTDVVFQYCRESKHAALLTPSHGRGVKASQKSLNEYEKKPGDRVGHHWRVPAVSKRVVRYVVFDGNHWKSAIAAGFRTAIGSKGAFTVFNHPRGAGGHRMLFEQLAAEKPKRMMAVGSGREVDEWIKEVGRDNHFGDCLVNAVVAASMQGITGIGHVVTKKRNYVKLSDIRRGS